VSRLFSDTSADAERVLVEGYRRMSPAERLRKVGELGSLARALVLADIRRRHPDATPHECALRLASRFIEPELMRRAFGWDPRREGY